MRISDWSSDVCSSDLEAVDRGGEPGEGRAEQHPQRHRQEYPQGQKAVEERKAFALRLRHRSSPSAATRLPASSITCSPSSLAKAPRWRDGMRARTSSEGRQSFTPSGETTSGRLMRIGCAIIASMRASRSDEQKSELQSLMRTSY